MSDNNGHTEGIGVFTLQELNQQKFNRKLQELKNQQVQSNLFNTVVETTSPNATKTESIQKRDISGVKEPVVHKVENVFDYTETPYKADSFFERLVEQLKPDEKSYADNQERNRRMAKAAALGDVFRHLGEFVGGRGYAPVEKRKENQRLYQILNMSEADRKEMEAKAERYRQNKAQYELSDYNRHKQQEEARRMEAMKAKQEQERQYTQDLNAMESQIYNAKVNAAETSTTQTTTGGGGTKTTFQSGTDNNNNKQTGIFAPFYFYHDGKNYMTDLVNAYGLSTVLMGSGYLTPEAVGLIQKQTSEGDYNGARFILLNAINKLTADLVNGSKSAKEIWDRYIASNKNFKIVPLSQNEDSVGYNTVYNANQYLNSINPNAIWQNP